MEGETVSLSDPKPEILSWILGEIKNVNEFLSRLLRPNPRLVRVVMREVEKSPEARGVQFLKDYANLSFNSVATPTLCTVRYMAEKVHLLEEAWKRHQKIVHAFGKFGSRTEALEQLTDPTSAIQLQLPRLEATETSPPLSFTYVGRSKLSVLLEIIRDKWEKVVRVGGLPGRGKSYMMAALASYLHTYEGEETSEVVVYILAGNLVDNLMDEFVEALLLAYARHGEKQLEILACDTLDKLKQFIEREQPLLLIDQANCLDVDKEKAPSTMAQRDAARSALGFRGVVRRVFCSSWSSTFIPYSNADVCMNEPFNAAEMDSWLSTLDHHAEKLPYEELLFYTGLIPRNLEEFVSGKSDYIRRRRNKLKDFVSSMTAKVAELVERVLCLEQHIMSELDPDIFYERAVGAGVCVTVVPFLDKELRHKVILKRQSVDLEEQFEKRRTGLHILMLVRNRLEKLLNGWIAEGLARDCILLQHKCLDWSFGSVVVYTEGSEAATLALSSVEDLKAGVCFLSSTAHVDIVIVQLESGKGLQVHGIQLTVSSWEEQLKDSHTLWLKDAAVVWSLGSCTTEVDFTYIHPRFEGQDVKDERVSFKKFVNVHKWLDVIDVLFNC